MDNVENLVKDHDFTVEQTVKEFKIMVILLLLPSYSKIIKLI